MRGARDPRIGIEMNTVFRMRSIVGCGLAAALGLSSACYTQKQYDAAVQDAKYHQTRLHERERTLQQLEDENTKLKMQLKQNEVTALSEAGYGQDLEARLSELQAKLDGLGRPIRDIERFDVEGGYVLMVQ